MSDKEKDKSKQILDTSAKDSIVSKVSEKNIPPLRRKSTLGIIVVIVIFILLVIISFPFLMPLPMERSLSSPQEVASTLEKRGEFLTIDGYITYVIDLNPESEKVLVFISEFELSAEIWRPHMEVFAESGYRTIAIDLKGSGFSQRDWAFDHSYKGQATLVSEVLKEKQVNSAAFIAHGTSTPVILEYSHQYGELAAGYVFLSGDESFSSHTSTKSAIKGTNMYTYRIKRQYLQRAYTSDNVRERLKNAVYKDEIVTDELVTRSMLSQKVRDWDIGTLAIARDTSSSVVSTEPLATSQTPTIIIWGKEDYIIPVERGIAFAEKIPQSEIYVIPDVGHLPMEEASGLSRAIIEEFLSKLTF